MRTEDRLYIVRLKVLLRSLYGWFRVGSNNLLVLRFSEIVQDHSLIIHHALLRPPPPRPPPAWMLSPITSLLNLSIRGMHRSFGLDGLVKRISICPRDMVLCGQWVRATKVLFLGELEITHGVSFWITVLWPLPRHQNQIENLYTSLIFSRDQLARSGSLHRLVSAQSIKLSPNRRNNHSQH